MRAYTVKRKGAATLGNMIFEEKMTFSDSSYVYLGYLFFRKKDAKKYLASMEYKEFYEVIGLTMDDVDGERTKSRKAVKPLSNECLCLPEWLVHRRERDAFFNGGDAEYDECIKCKKRQNFKRV